MMETVDQIKISSKWLIPDPIFKSYIEKVKFKLKSANNL